ncbi:HAMP domain-containing sensor histidine kinase [Paenibacillus sp. BC26]|uniref:HAMP domain-containing sensor histidine kinase n=1 Tax=Paenibacillus sp. BC26 TaxID=1881032 RepID=UPI0008ED2AF8|nr:HAMP domain-containing sensor histidine kinase [Paenibacillus sp. BC26]SFS75191.1 Signal transduction histidine kinase [Paenibacillus sp. BC26]
MPKWKRFLFGLAGVLLMNLAIYTCYTAAYTIVSYTKEKRNHSAATSALLHEVDLITITLANRENVSEWIGGLKSLSNSKGYRFKMIDAAGREQIVGELQDGDKEIATAVEWEHVVKVLAGGSVEDVERGNIFGKGLAMVGMPVDIGGQRYALFAERNVPSLYTGFWQQLFTVFLGFLLLFILLFLIGRPWRHREGFNIYISAIRRMSKGDFSVSIELPKQMRGEFSELAHSINDMAAELSQMEQMRQTFISNVSHEIQSPLTSIRGFARVLQQSKLEVEQRQHYASIIETESVRLSRLSDNLLKLTTLEADQQPMRMKPFRLDQQLRSTILACEPQWTEKDLLMDVNLDEEVTYSGDEELLSQVWTNVLANSMKFTPEGGSISVEVKRTSGGASVCISDNGLGISEEDLPHIFERFFKADKARSRMAGGSGLGLSIVKRIVEMHGGTVTASSKPGSGTTITVFLPDAAAKQQ